MTQARDHDPDAPRWRRLPLDGQWHEIEVRPMLIDWSGKPQPRSARGLVRVVAIDDGPPRQHASDADGWVYARWGYPWGWSTNDVHISTIIGQAIADFVRAQQTAP